MKLLTIALGTLAALCTMTSAMPTTPEQELELAARADAGFVSDIVDEAVEVPGLKEFEAIKKCIKEDKTWKAIWNLVEAGIGILLFTEMSAKCCEMAKEASTKYEEDWKESGYIIGVDYSPDSPAPCNSGAVFSNNLEFLEKLHKDLGDGH